MTVERLICDPLGFQSDHVRRRTLCKSISLTMNLEDHTDDTDDVLGKLYFKVDLWCFFLKKFSILFSDFLLFPFGNIAGYCSEDKIFYKSYS